MSHSQILKYLISVKSSIVRIVTHNDNDDQKQTIDK